MSPIQTLMPPSQKVSAAVDLAGVEGGDGVVEGHLTSLLPASVGVIKCGDGDAATELGTAAALTLLSKTRPRRTCRSPRSVRHSEPFGHSRRSIRPRSYKRSLISGDISACARVPSTAARAFNSDLLRITPAITEM
jgi:hypothetical protein